MSLKSVIDLFAQTAGADVKALRAADAALVQNQGVMTTLATNHKDTLTGAINELKLATDGKPDLSTVNQMLSTAKDEIIGSAPGVYTTLTKISEYIANDANVAAALADALAKRVRVDAPQNFTEAEQAQGRDNLKAASAIGLTTLETGVGDYANADPRGVYIAARDAA